MSASHRDGLSLRLRAARECSRGEIPRSLRTGLQRTNRDAELVRGLPAAIYTCDASGRITFYNEAAAELWGLEPELGKDLWCGSYRIYRTDGTPLPLDECPMAIALKEGRPVFNREIVIERPDGTRRNVLPYPRPLLDRKGRVTGAVNMLVDVTESKRSAAELASTKDDLALQVRVMTRLHDLAMQLAETSELQPALQAVLETLVEVHGAQHGLVWLHEPVSGRLEISASVGFPASVLCQLNRIRPGPVGSACGNSFAGRKRIVIGDTELDPTFEAYRELARSVGVRALHSTPILTRSGQILGVLSVHFDAPRVPSERERKLADLCARQAAEAIDDARARQALREREQHFRDLADTAPAMLWITGTDGTCTFLSRGWYEFTGQTPETGLGQGWIEAVHPEDRESACAVQRTASSRREAFSVDYRVRRADGQYRWVNGSGRPRTGPWGEFQGYIGAVIDITERKLLQAELRQRIEELARSDQRKDEFLAMLAHELRNPLAPLRNGLELLKGSIDEQLLEEVRAMMDRQVQQLVRLIDDLMDVSRISRGRIELRRERIDLRAAVASAEEISRPLIEDSGHEFTIQLPSEELHVEADATRLAQVFANLLNNAAKYTEPGGHIRLSLERANGCASVSVKDDGVGIPPHMLSRVFEMFAQVDPSLERARSGLGIGLSIVKRLVEMHGGSVEARSDGPGAGSEFIVRLPLAGASGAKRESRSGAGAERIVDRRRILVVDDNHDSACSLALMLEVRGHETRTAHDGHEALKLAEAFRPHAILMDLGMPRLNGYQTCQRIREHAWGREPCLVAVTGWGQDQDRSRSREAGFDHHLVKPVDPAKLEEILAGIERMDVASAD